MMKSFRSVLFAVSVCTLVCVVYADEPAAANNRAAALVKQLHDRSFKVRERASRELVDLGPAAVPALRVGCKDTDPEVRRRCQALLPLALKRDRDRLLDKLLADKNAGEDYALPGWKRYREIVGKETAARRLYVDMVRVHGDLLKAADDDPSQAANQVTQMVQRFQSTGIRSLVDVGALALAGASPKVGQRGFPYAALCPLLETHWPSLIGEPTQKQHLRPLLEDVMRRSIDAGQTQGALRLGLRLKLKGTAEFAAKQLKQKNANSGDRGMAAYVLGKIGGKQHLRLLESLLNDRAQFSSFSTGGVSGTTEVGDVALASLVRLTEQDLHAYQYPAANLDEESLRIHAAAILGFPSDAVRAESKAKWKAWAAKNLPKK